MLLYTLALVRSSMAMTRRGFADNAPPEISGHRRPTSALEMDLVGVLSQHLQSTVDINVEIGDTVWSANRVMMRCLHRRRSLQTRLQLPLLPALRLSLVLLLRLVPILDLFSGCRTWGGPCTLHLVLVLWTWKLPWQSTIVRAQALHLWRVLLWAPCLVLHRKTLRAASMWSRRATIL